MDDALRTRCIMYYFGSKIEIHLAEWNETIENPKLDKITSKCHCNTAAEKRNKGPKAPKRKIIAY